MFRADVRPGDMYALHFRADVSPQRAVVHAVYPDGTVGLVSEVDDFVYKARPGHPAHDPFELVERDCGCGSLESFEAAYERLGFDDPQTILEYREGEAS